jgi:hypothetical protein
VICTSTGLAGRGENCHGPEMFVVTEADAAAICTISDEEGELAAAIELRRRSPESATTLRQGHVPGSSPGGRRLRSR